MRANSRFAVCRCAGAGLLLAFAMPTLAAAVVIEPDDFAHGGAMTAPAPGVRLRAHDDPAGSVLDTAEVVALDSPYAVTGTRVFGNNGSNASWGNGDFEWLHATFDASAKSVSIDFNPNDSSDSNAFLRAYDERGALLDSAATPVGAPQTGPVTLTVNAPNIAYVTASWDDRTRRENGALDRLVYEPADRPSPVFDRTIWAVEEFGAPKRGSVGDQIIRFNADAPSIVSIVGDTGIADTQMSGLEFDGGGALYAYGEQDHSVAPGLYSIDPLTGAATFIGIGGVEADDSITDLSWDPVTETMYAISGSVTGRRLYTLDLSTGHATAVGRVANLPAIAVQVGLATDANGVRYVHDAQSDRMYRLAGPDGLEAVAFPDDIGYDSNESQGMTIDWSFDGDWYHAASRRRGALEPERELYEVVASGHENLVGPVGPRFEAFEGITLVPANDGGTAIPLKRVDPAFKPGDIAMKPVDPQRIESLNSTLTSVASLGKRGLRPGGEYQAAVLEFANLSSGPLADITLIDAHLSGPDAVLFSLPDFIDNHVLGAGDVLRVPVRFFAPGIGDPGFKSFYRATLDIVTDVRSARGVIGESYLFALGVQMVGAPATAPLLALGLALAARRRLHSAVREARQARG